MDGYLNFGLIIWSNQVEPQDFHRFQISLLLQRGVNVHSFWTTGALMKKKYDGGYLYIIYDNSREYLSCFPNFKRQDIRNFLFYNISLLKQNLTKYSTLNSKFETPFSKLKQKILGVDNERGEMVNSRNIPNMANQIITKLEGYIRVFSLYF